MTRLIDADALMEKSFEIEYADGWHKSVTKEVVSVRDIDNAPTIDPNELDLDIDYSIEYDKRPDGISNAKVTITRIKSRNIAKVADIINVLPSDNRPKGEWVVENHEVVCSVCGQNNLETNFCPNCGADMRGDVM